MEKLCEQLRSDKDYDRLVQYLNFLMDLLGRTSTEDVSYIKEAIGTGTSLAKIVGESFKELSDESYQRERTTQVRTVATKLCGEIIQDFQGSRIHRAIGQRVLYSAARLLETSKTADLKAAIYVKLYDMADRLSGPCVWAVFLALEALRQLSIDDRIALTTLSLWDEEEADGTPSSSNPRNYLISSKERNECIWRKCTLDAKDGDLLACYYHLELNRLKYLSVIIEALHQMYYSQESSDIERLSLVEFMDDYIHPGQQNVPIQEKLARIKGHLPKLENEISFVIKRLLATNVSRNISHAELIQKFSKMTAGNIRSFRNIGKEIMNRLVERLRPFELRIILRETQQYLNQAQPLIDFHAALGLWSQKSEEKGHEKVRNKSLLDSDPGASIPILEGIAWQRAAEGEAELAEAVYRAGLALCKSCEEEREETGRILHALTRMLRDQHRYEEALRCCEEAV